MNRELRKSGTEAGLSPPEFQIQRHGEQRSPLQIMGLGKRNAEIDQDSLQGALHFCGDRCGMTRAQESIEFSAKFPPQADPPSAETR